MSCIETVKLQMVMGMEPKSTCQDTIDHPTGGDRTLPSTNNAAAGSKKPDRSSSLSP